MRVIVSSSLEDSYNGYKVVRSFKEVRTLKDISCLIIHKYSESDFDAGVFIAEFHKIGIKNFVYICKDSSITMKMVLKGVGAVILDDEFYYESEDELNSLLEDIGLDLNEEGTSLASSSLIVINEFMQAFARGEEKTKLPVYLDQVKMAIKDLYETTRQQEIQIKDMGTSAVGIFEKASSIITSIDAQRKILEVQLQSLVNAQQGQVSSSSRDSFADSRVLFFPTYRYMGGAKVLLIRELSPCRYLTSFMLAYHHYLDFDMNKRVKLIFAHQKGAGVSAKYNKFTSITQESMQDEGLYASSVVATNNPKTEVLKALTSRNDDVIIVIDRLYGREDIISTKVVKINAVSGMSDLERFSVKPKNCIFSINSHPDNLFCINNIKNYPPDQETRFAAYNQSCKEQFKILNKMLLL